MRKEEKKKVAKDVGIHGCFFCGASVKIEKADAKKVVYVCSKCGKKVTVTVEKKD